MSKVEMFSKFLTGIVNGGAIGHIFPEIAKKYAGHIFTQLPTGAASVGLGAGIGVAIRIIDAGLGCGKLGEWMEKHRFVKELSSFALTQITGAVAGMALTGGSTGIITVAAMVAAIWLLVKVTDDCLNRFNEKLLAMRYEKQFKELRLDLDLSKILNNLGVDRINCFKNDNECKFYKDNKEVNVSTDSLEKAKNCELRNKRKRDSILNINDVYLMDVKNNRYIKPLQDKLKEYELKYKIIMHMAKDERITVEQMLSDLKKQGFTEQLIKLLNESKMKMEKEGLQKNENY